MNQIFGTSETGNLHEAISNIHSPSLLFLISNEEQFETHVSQLEGAFPGVPSIGCIAMSYDTHVIEKGVGVVSYTGDITATVNTLEQASTMPVKYIRRLQEDLNRIEASSRNTVCINFCTGNDACVLTTMHSVLNSKKISLMGTTGGAGKISANGRIYEDAVAYALVKNNTGKVKIYKENIYQPRDNYRLIASKTNKSNYVIGELNGKPAKQLYKEILEIDDQAVTTQTFQNPLGKINGQDICIIAIKEPLGNTLSCYRPVNDSDVLTILEAKDPLRIVNETVAQIQRDFTHVSGIFSVNCILRNLFFSQIGALQQYLDVMETVGSHAGLFGFGEHFNNQFLNQTMTCVVFE